MKFPSVATAVCAAALCSTGARGQLPADVRAGHWAAPAVTRALQTGLMRLQTDRRFHGDAKVTRLEAVTAIGKLGHALVDGTWKSGGRSRPVPDSVTALWEKTDWKAEPVRRYALAVILTRFGDYVANALPRPARGASVGKSQALPDVSVTLSPHNPAYDTIVYLARSHMVKPGSVLLKPNGSALLGGDLSRGLAELATGVNDRLTDLGKNPDGSTPDDALHKPAPR